MRLAALTLAAGLVAGIAASANATPMVPNLQDQSASNIIQVSGGCGWGFHRNYRGFCVHDRHYRPYAYYRPHYRHHYYQPYGYYGGGYRWPHRYWYGY